MNEIKLKFEKAERYAHCEHHSHNQQVKTATKQSTTKHKAYSYIGKGRLYLCDNCYQSLKREQLQENNPSVPDKVFDIETSQEVIDQYHDMFGY